MWLYAFRITWTCFSHLNSHICCEAFVFLLKKNFSKLFFITTITAKNNYVLTFNTSTTLHQVLAFFRFIVVSSFHCPVFAQRIQGLQFLDHEFTHVDHSRDLGRIGFPTVSHKRIVALDAELFRTTGVLAAQILQLWTVIKYVYVFKINQRQM